MNRPSKKTEPETVTASALAQVQEDVVDAAIARFQRQQLERERAALRERVDRSRREAEEAAARREAERQAAICGGPCVFCGVERSEQDGIGRWYEDQRGPVCAACEGDRLDYISLRQYGPSARIYWPDEMNRVKAIRHLLGPEISRWWMDEFLLERAKFKWWYELPASRRKGGGVRRFAYTSSQQISNKLTPPAKPVEYRDGDPCPKCGCAHMWYLKPGFEGVFGTATGINETTGETWTETTVLAPASPEHWACGGCREPHDFEETLAGLLGVKLHLSTRLYVPGRVVRAAYFSSAPWAQWIPAVTTEPQMPLGVGWYSDLPEDDRRRKLTKAPWQYLDLSELRRKVYRLGYTQPSDWRAPALWEWVDRTEGEKMRAEWRQQEAEAMRQHAEWLAAHPPEGEEAE